MSKPTNRSDDDRASEFPGRLALNALLHLPVAAVLLLLSSGAVVLYIHQIQEQQLALLEQGNELERTAQNYKLRIQRAVLAGYASPDDQNVHMLAPSAESLDAIRDLESVLRHALGRDRMHSTDLDQARSLRQRILDHTEPIREPPRLGQHGPLLPTATPLAGHGSRQAPDSIQTLQDIEALEDIIDQLIVAADARSMHAQQALQNKLLLATAANVVILALSGAITIWLASMAASRRRQLQASATALQASNDALDTHILENIAAFAQLNSHLQNQFRRAALLVRDLHHRVGNSLQLAASLLALQAIHEARGDAVPGLRLARWRVMTIAAAQRRLELTPEGEYIRCGSFFSGMIDDILGSLESDLTARLEQDDPALRMNPKDATLAAVILAELLRSVAQPMSIEVDEESVIVRLSRVAAGSMLCLELIADPCRARPSANQTGAPESQPQIAVVERLAGAMGGHLVWQPDALDDDARQHILVRAVIPNHPA